MPEKLLCIDKRNFLGFEQGAGFSLHKPGLTEH